ncbi:MAG TPA: hypothetical protein VII58_06930, partial [Acidobacteriaceae bacterium]
MSDSQDTRKRSGAGFFHVDRRTWKLLCGRGDMDQAVSYLVVASGTGPGNLVSGWSAKAVEIYTGRHRTRAKAAITELIAAGFLVRVESSPRTHPRYEIQPFEVAHGAALDAAILSSGGVFDLITRATTGDGWAENADRVAVAPYVLQGLLWPSGDLFALSPATERSMELIWFPNSLVTGVDGKPSPVRRLRAAGDLWALRLLVDLYSAQNLSMDSGISRAALRADYTRKEYVRRARHVVWSFSFGVTRAYEHPATAAFWQAASLTGEYVRENNHF